MTNNDAYKQENNKSRALTITAPSSAHVEEFLIAMNEFKKVLHSQRSVYC